MENQPSIDKLLSHLEDVELTTVHGRITEVVGMLIRAVVPQVKMGELCLIKRSIGEPLAAEVVGFTRDEILLSPLGDMRGIGPSSEVIPMRMPMHAQSRRELFGLQFSAQSPDPPAHRQAPSCRGALHRRHTHRRQRPKSRDLRSGRCR